jgi:hypothetical protein
MHKQQVLLCNAEVTEQALNLMQKQQGLHIMQM